MNETNSRSRIFRDKMKQEAAKKTEAKVVPYNSKLGKKAKNNEKEGR